MAYVVHGQPFKAVRVWEVDGLVYGVTKMYGGRWTRCPTSCGSTPGR